MNAAALPAVQRTLAWIADHPEFCETETVAIARTPAPTFAEGQRAAVVEQRLRDLGAEDVHTFGSGNVCGRLGPDRSPGLGLLAHLDTVFAAGVDHAVTKRDGLLYGPGVGDNSAGIAGILTVLTALRQSGTQLSRPVWFVANVGEEGLGDLRGARETLAHLDGRLGAVVAVEGTMLGRLGHVAVGSRRLRVLFQGEGGHSWLDFGRPSAVHAAVAVAAKIIEIPVPSDPRTTFNVGEISGGDGVNVIASTAWFVLDMRSINTAALAALGNRVQTILSDARDHSGVQITVEQVGDRPAGSIPRTHPFVEACAAALEFSGVRAEATAGSTDANIPLSLGIPAVALGITRGGGIHGTGEWIEVAPMRQGVQQLALLIAALCA